MLYVVAPQKYFNSWLINRFMANCGLFQMLWKGFQRSEIDSWVLNMHLGAVSGILYMRTNAVVHSDKEEMH